MASIRVLLAIVHIFGLCVSQYSSPPVKPKPPGGGNPTAPDPAQGTGFQCAVVSGTLSGSGFSLGLNADQTCITGSTQTVPAGTKITCCVASYQCSIGNDAISGTTYDNSGSVAFDMGGAYVPGSVSFTFNSAYSSSIIGSYVQVSSTSDFSSDIVDVGQITTLSEYQNVGGLILSLVGPYRYLRIAGVSSTAITSLSLTGCPGPNTCVPSTVGGFLQIGSSTPVFTFIADDSSKTPSNIHDGDFNTYYASGANGWVGFDLGAQVMIKGFKYAPRSGYANTLSGAKVQLSNYADFRTVVNVGGDLPGNSVAGQWNQVNFNIGGVYQYARVLANQAFSLAELEFLGCATANCESWITPQITGTSNPSGSQCILPFARINVSPRWPTGDGAAALEGNYNSQTGKWWSWFNAGTYTLKYKEGSIKYTSASNYAVNNWNSNNGYSLKNGSPSSSDTYVKCPGSNTEYSSTSAAASGNAGKFVNFYHPGGNTYLSLTDSTPSNNVKSSGANAPTFQFSHYDWFTTPVPVGVYGSNYFSYPQSLLYYYYV